MPFLRALAAAATVLVVAAVGLVAVGGAFGNPWLLLPRVPPRSGMDRFLLMVWPVACLVEVLLAGLGSWWSRRASVGVASAVRLVTVGCLGWVLLWGSVHLRGQPDWLLMALWTAGAAAVWQSVPRQKAQHVVGAAICVTLIATGVLIVWGGWLKGGLTAVPLAVATGLAAWRIQDEHLRGVVLGCGTAAVVGLVALGHFFGRVSTLQAAVLADCLVALAVVVSWPRLKPPEPPAQF